MMTPSDNVCWKNSSGATTLPKPFDCTSVTSPSLPNIFTARPINSEPRIFVSTNCLRFRKKSWRGQAITRSFVRCDSLCQDFEARVPARGHSFLHGRSNDFPDPQPGGGGKNTHRASGPQKSRPVDDHLRGRFAALRGCPTCE